VPLFGLQFIYADGSVFYTGNAAGDVAGNSSTTVTDNSGHVIGTYTIFRDGVTNRPVGSVNMNRFIDNGSSFVLLGNAPFHGFLGPGSETGSISYNGLNFVVNNQAEPVLPPIVTTIPSAPPPSATDVISGEVIQIYREVLGRNPDPGGFASATALLAHGTSVAQFRLIVAQSPEAQNDLNGLYRQILHRDIDPSGQTSYTSLLAGGGTLNMVEQNLAQSPEAASRLEEIYLQVLGRDADPVGLAGYQGALAGSLTLDGVRSEIAHSAESQSDLITLFQDTTGRAPGIAELLGMQDQLAVPGTTQQMLTSSLASNDTGGAYVLITADVGNATLTALPQTPTLFTFAVNAFGNDVVNGFDQTRDTIALLHTQVATFADLQTHIASVNNGTLISLDPTQSIQINGIAPSGLSPHNFIFV
jgi:hypothetical protein